MDAKLEARLNHGTDYHPMQMIPVFRRWRLSTLRNLILTGIMCAVIAAIISITIAAFGGNLTWKRIYEITTVTMSIGYVQHYVYKFFIGLARRRPSWARWIMHPAILGLALPVGTNTMSRAESAAMTDHAFAAPVLCAIAPRQLVHAASVESRGIGSQLQRSFPERASNARTSPLAAFVLLLSATDDPLTIRPLITAGGDVS